MGREISPWSENKISKRIRLGFGQGSGSSYKPWIGVRDISSRGTSTRLWSPKVGRTLQFLSNVERDAFLVAEYRDDFLDYLEQHPLERSRTMVAARKLGVRHPVYPGTKTPVVMTIDGLLFLKRGEEVIRRVVDCKHSLGKFNERTLEKLAIVQQVCDDLALPRIAVTELSVPRHQVHNILWCRMAMPRAGEVEPAPRAFEIYPMRMYEHLRVHQMTEFYAEMNVLTYCRLFEESAIESQFLPAGFGLRCMKILMWTRRVDFDLNAKRPELLLVNQLLVGGASAERLAA
jgi:hypothetical protein